MSPNAQPLRLQLVCSFSSGVGWLKHGLNELRALPHVSDIEREQGRIFFKYDGPLEALKKLKSCERLSMIICRATRAELGDDVQAYIKEESKIKHAQEVWTRVCGRAPRDFRITVRKKGHPELRSADLTLFIAGLVFHTWETAKVNVLRGDYDGEVNVHLNEEELCMTLTLFRQPRTGPENFHHQGLNQIVSWALCMTADIQTGDVVLDPMCGAGIICLEGALSWPAAEFFGIDSSSEQLEKFITNRNNRCVDNIQIMKGDVRELCVRDQTIDVVICDLPYGKLFGSEEENQTLYPAAVSEMRRILKDNGRIVLLTNVANQDLLVRTLIDQKFEIHALRTLNLGFMEAIIVVARKGNQTAVEIPEETKRLKWESANGRQAWNAVKLKMRPPLVRACRNK